MLHTHNLSVKGIYGSAIVDNQFFEFEAKRKYVVSNIVRKNNNLRV